MPNAADLLQTLRDDPNDEQALAGILALDSGVLADDESARLLSSTRRVLRERGALEAASKILDVEISLAAEPDVQAQLLLEQGSLQIDELGADDAAEAYFRRALEVSPQDKEVHASLEAVAMVRDNAPVFAEKFKLEAEAATDRDLASRLFASAALMIERTAPASEEVEALLTRALDLVPRNRRAAAVLRRRLRRTGRWAELAEFLRGSVAHIVGSDERAAVFADMADALHRAGRPDESLEAWREVMSAQPSHQRAMVALVGELENRDDPQGLVEVYEKALSGRKADDKVAEIGILMQLGMLCWKRLEDLDRADEYFRRVRKLEPSNAALLDFYRDFYPARGEAHKLLQLLRQALRQVPEDDGARRMALLVEMATVAESGLGNVEKAIDAWKQVLRADPSADQARDALKRLYRRSEKWNALLDLMKDEIELLPEDDVAARIDRLADVVEIYRDRLNLPTMVISTYNSILALDPSNNKALSELAGKYEQLGRWNDLIGVLGRQVATPGIDDEQKITILRRMASLWVDQFGNFAQAISPLEELLALRPGDTHALEQLKEIYERRRQWRPLLELLEREALHLGFDVRREHYISMARLAAERLGDNRMAIELWNRVAELPGPDAGPGHLDEVVVAALTGLYEREKRYVSLAELYRRKRELLADDPRGAVAVLDRLGNLLADRLHAPEQAAAVYREILELEPHNGRALRTLRELYAQSGNYAELEAMFGELGQWAELVDSLSTIADRVTDRERRVSLLLRAAQVAQKHFAGQEKVARAYERLLSVDGENLEAARALVPIYQKLGKWARLLAVYEIVLAHADPAEHLELILEIREICERKLQSKMMAFQWTRRAFELAPLHEGLVDDLERLGMQADAWEDVVAVLDARVNTDGVGADERLTLLRILGRLAATRLHKAELARKYQQQVLELDPNDASASQALEDIAREHADWPNLLKIYRGRAASESDVPVKIEQLFRIAHIEDTQMGDRGAASKTYGEILDADPSSRRAVRALAKIREEEGDIEGMVAALRKEIALVGEVDSKVELHLRIGELCESALAEPAEAVEAYREALALAPGRAAVREALERLLDPQRDIDDDLRVDVARLLLPIFEQGEDASRLARVIGVLRTRADADQALVFDKRLVGLYGRLDRIDDAFAASIRVLQADPMDADNREAFLRFGGELGKWQETAQHLQSALSALGEQEADRAVLRDIAVAVAELYDVRVVDPERAEEAWRRVVEIDSGEESAYEALQRLYNAAERFQDLRNLLLEREKNTSDSDRRKELLLHIAEIDQDVLDDRDGAISAYKAALEIDPSLMLAYKALERLYHAAEQWAALDELLARENDYLESDSEHIDVTSRRAALKADKLDDVNGAIDLAEDVVARAPNHGPTRGLLEGLLSNAAHRVRVAKILEPLYREDGMWRDLGEVLRAQLEDDVVGRERLDLLAQMALVQEERLGNFEGARVIWTEALSVDAGAEEPRRALLRIAANSGDWEGVARAFEEVLEGSDSTVKRQLLVHLSEIYDRHLGDVDGAIRAYQGQVDLDPGNPETARPALLALDRIYEAYDRWADLAPVVRRVAEWAESPEERRDLLTRLAGIYEHNLHDDGASINTWRDVLVDEPDDARALDSLERLFISSERFKDLAEIVRRRVEVAHDDVDKRAQLRRLATLNEEQLEDVPEAVVALLEVLDFAPDDDSTLAELARLYRGTERFPDLYEVLARRLSLADNETIRLALSAEVGQLLHKHLDRPSEALERYADVLAVEPENEAALSAVEEIFRDEENLQARASMVLEPIYRAQQRYAQLAKIQGAMAEAVSDPRDRLQRLLSVASLRDSHLDDPEGAFAAYTDAVRVAAAEPELADIIEQLERLAGQLQRRRALIEVYRNIAPDVLDGTVQRHLYLAVADLAWTEERDVVLAREYYQLVMDQSPDDDRALLALEDIYRQSEDWEALAEILARKADRAGDDFEPRINALAQLATVADEKLGKADDSVLAWEQVLELVPDNSTALDSLESLYRRGERWHDLADLLERRLGYTFNTTMAVELRFELGQLYEQNLSDPDNAVACFAATLEGSASHAGARAALERYLDDPGTRTEAARTLEPIYVAHQDWPKLVRIYEIKLEAADDRDERLILTRYIARLYEDQLEDLDGAFRWYGRVFREDPGDLSVRDQLMRLASVLESWEQLANVYQEFLDDETDEAAELMSVASSLAEIYDRRLGEIERAHVAYRRVLSAQPDHRDAFLRLESMLQRAERWYALIELYEDTIESSLDDVARVNLYLRMAGVFEQQLGDPSKAVDAYRAIHEIDSSHQVATAELDRLYQDLERWFDLAELLGRLIDSSEDGRQGNTYRLRLADLSEAHLGDIPGAVDHYEVALTLPGAQTALNALERLVLLESHRERIAAILEPLYRQNDWWQKLVIILDAQLDFVDDPARRRAMLREIAQIHEARGGDQRLALRALARAWKDDIRDEEVYGELAALVAKLGAWNDMVEVLEAGIVDTYDYDQLAIILTRLAEIHESHRSDLGAAIAAWGRLLEVKDDDIRALAELDRLYEGQERWAEQVKMILRRAELANDVGPQVELLRRAGRRLEEDLADSEGAIAEYRNIVGLAESDRDALDALERLYTRVENWSELVQILASKLELEEQPDERRRLRFDAALVHDRKLGDVYEAIASLLSQLEETPDDGDALEQLDALYEREAMWSELLEIVDRRVELATDAGAKAELGYRGAKVVEDKLVDAEGSIERYAKVLELVPIHRGAREALDHLTRNDDTLWPAADLLERLYRSENDHDSVVDLYERRLKSNNAEPEARLGFFTELASLHERSRSDIESAFRAWARALAEFPERAELRGQLERIAAETGTWKHLAAEFENRLADTSDGDLEFVYADELGRIYDRYLGDLERSAEKLQQALIVTNDESSTLAKLASAFTRSERWPELAEVLERQSQVADADDEQAQFLFLLADLREQRLGLLPDAVEALRDVLERDPRHIGARSALWRLLSHDGLRAEIIVILEPLFEDEQNYEQLADLLLHKLSVTDDQYERAALYARVSEIAEESLGDPVRALDAAGGWLAEDPQSEDALGNLERLADNTGRWDEVAARIKGILDSGQAETMRPVLLAQLGTAYLVHLSDQDRAEKCFRDLASLDPESSVALTSLEQIFRDRGDQRMLSEMVRRLADLEGDIERKKARLAEVGQLREALGDPDGAAEAWRDVVDVDESSRDAHSHLASIYQSRANWGDLIDVLGLAANHAADPREEAQLRARIAHVYADELGDLDAAAEAWQRALDIDPNDLAALSSIEAIHMQLEDWDAVREVLLRRLEVVGEGQRVDVLARLVELALEKRNAPEEAIAHTQEVLEIDPQHEAAAAKLEELFRGGEQWHELIEHFEARAALHSSDDRGTTYLAQIADIWEGPLENPDAASEVLEQILERKPDFVPALTRLAKIYEDAGDWERCEDVLQRALGLGPTGSQAADLHFRLAEVARAKDDDLEAAVSHYQQALASDESHLGSMKAIATIARDGEDWTTLADMLSRELKLASDKEEIVELAVQLAELYTSQLREAAAAVPILEHAAQSAPDDRRVLGPLADAYFDAGRIAEAEPMYETLADEAKRGRRMKDLARYKQRMGGILEATGNMERALAAYEEAFRVDPTNVATMTGLGRLYIDAENWDKARRVYRSMVLQTLDPGVGITKAEVFYNLGYIHVQLGEMRKAKSMFQRGLELEPDNEKLVAGLESVGS